MPNKLVMGNEAIAFGAIGAGINLVSGYPGTPSTEVLETIAKNNPGHIHVQWSVNEKVALEVAAGASYAGGRTLVTMKQVGLNVATDPLMSLAYIGVKGGMVILVADDPGPISSQTEQDTRRFAGYANIPIFDPSTPEEAFKMVKDAYRFSEEYRIPVILRPTTRICHACAPLDIDNVPRKRSNIPSGFEKSPDWVIFPRLSYTRHWQMTKRDKTLSEDFSDYEGNNFQGSGRMGIAASGIAYAHTADILKELGAEAVLLKISTPHPFPKPLVADMMKTVDKILVIEELDPVIEENLLLIAAEKKMNLDIYGKHNYYLPKAGEYNYTQIKHAIADFLDIDIPSSPIGDMDVPPLPARPPVLCAGCPHRASFYAVKSAVKEVKDLKKAVFTGDIGCYTLGNTQPLDMVDTCLCMGAGLTIAQGIHHIESEKTYFAFIGDSTFFHTGIPGVINAVYNKANLNFVILDNKTTAMTGHQPHPGLGKTVMGEERPAISIEKMVEACGIPQEAIFVLNPLNLRESVETVKKAMEYIGATAIIFRSPCIALSKEHKSLSINKEKCLICKKCINEIGCPALYIEDGRLIIADDLCTGCGLCNQICPTGAIEKNQEVGK